MAIQLECGRDAPASRPEPAGYSGSSCPYLFAPLASDARLQGQLVELEAIHAKLRALDAEWPGAGESVTVLRPACGEFLLHPDVCRFRRELAALTGACAALARQTQTRLDRARPGLERLRGMGENGRREVGHERR